MKGTEEPKVKYEMLTTGYEFPPVTFQFDIERLEAYRKAVEGRSHTYRENNIIPPMAIAAQAMTAMSAALVLPPGVVHVSQNLELTAIIKTGEKLTSYARVTRKLERGKFHVLNIEIKVTDQNQKVVLSGETGFILPFGDK